MSIQGEELDAKRTEFLKRFNVRVIRFENKEVFESMEFVLEEIRQNLKGVPGEPPRLRR